MDQNLKSITDVVADELKGAGPKIAGILRDQLVDAKIAKRVELLKAGMAKLEQLRKENRGIKPDAVTIQLGPDGSKRNVENWT